MNSDDLCHFILIFLFIYETFTKEIFISLMGFHFLYISPSVSHFFFNLLFQESHLKFKRIEKSIFSCFLYRFFENFVSYFLLLKISSICWLQMKQLSIVLCQCYSL